MLSALVGSYCFINISKLGCRQCCIKKIKKHAFVLKNMGKNFNFKKVVKVENTAKLFFFFFYFGTHCLDIFHYSNVYTSYLCVDKTQASGTTSTDFPECFILMNEICSKKGLLGLVCRRGEWDRRFGLGW